MVSPAGLPVFPLLLALLLAAPSFAAAAERAALDVDGLRREYLLVRPPKAAAKPFPLVLVLHGHLGRVIVEAQTHVERQPVDCPPILRVDTDRAGQTARLFRKRFQSE